MRENTTNATFRGAKLFAYAPVVYQKNTDVNYKGASCTCTHGQWTSAQLPQAFNETCLLCALGVKSLFRLHVSFPLFSQTECSICLGRSISCDSPQVQNLANRIPRLQTTEWHGIHYEYLNTKCKGNAGPVANALNSRRWPSLRCHTLRQFHSQLEPFSAS